jgi:hypothetical protein
MAKIELLETVMKINKMFGETSYTNGAFKLDIAYGGYRLVRIVSEGGAETDLSPRLKASEMREYLNGFIKGADLMFYQKDAIVKKELA